MERETENGRARRQKMQIRPREGSTKKEEAKFYILRGWLLRVFDKEDDLKEAVTCALRASVGWLLEAQDEEALEVFGQAGELFENTMTGIRGRRRRTTAQQEYCVLIDELLGELEGAQGSVLRSAAVQLYFYSGVVGQAAMRVRQYERAYQLLRALGEEGALHVPMRVRSAILDEAAHLRKWKQPEEAAALYEQVVILGQTALQEGADPKDVSRMGEQRLLLFRAWDAASSLYLMYLCRLRLLRAAKWYIRMLAMCGEYLGWCLREKLDGMASVMKRTAASLAADARFRGLLFAMMMTLLMMTAYMCLNR